jgi:hypothetical protein
MTLREAILISVNARQGINGVDLVLNCMGLVHPFFEDKDYTFELAELVSSGEIVELEYILPTMTYRLKSLYFPKGTKLYANQHTIVHEETTAHSNNAQSGSIFHRRNNPFRLWMDYISRRWKNTCSRVILRRRNRNSIGSIHTRAY